jgi:acyl-coenzyme A synthetase/AMP-(fatty) acid ligase
VAAVIEGQPFSAELEMKIRAELGKVLTKYEVPRHFYFTPYLEKTPTGKVDRAANLKRIMVHQEFP